MVPAVAEFGGLVFDVVVALDEMELQRDVVANPCLTFSSFGYHGDVPSRSACS